MLTLPADLTPAQMRAIDALVHTALTGEKVEWCLWYLAGDDEGWHPVRQDEPFAHPMYQLGPGYCHVPSYFTGDACWRLVEEMLKSQQQIQIWLDPAPDWARVDGIVIGGPQVWPSVRIGRNSGIGPTYQAAVVACFLDSRGVSQAQVYAMKEKQP